MGDYRNPDRLRSKSFRTINPADQMKPDMQSYNKYSPTKKVTAPRLSDLPIHAYVNKYDKTCEKKLLPPMKQSYYAHGRLLYVVKAGILVGAAYFTYAQGVWGDQQDTMECIHRWQEYMRSLNTRRAPDFDQCGNVIRHESSASLIAPLCALYKGIVTTCFSGVVKVPLMLKCAYLDYQKSLERQEADLERQRKLKKSLAK